MKAGSLLLTYQGQCIGCGRMLSHRIELPVGLSDSEVEGVAGGTALAFRGRQSCLRCDPRAVPSQ